MIFAVLYLIVILIIAGCVVFRGNRSARPAASVPAASVPAANAGRGKRGADTAAYGTVKIDKKDTAIMTVMALVFFLLAVYRLGGFTVFKTSWTPSAAGEGFVEDFGKPVAVSKISLYPGPGQGSYKVEVADEKGIYQTVSTMGSDKYYEYFYGEYAIIPPQGKSTKISSLRVTAEIPGGTLNEIAVFGEASKEPLKGRIKGFGSVSGNASGSAANNASGRGSGNTGNLVDEQDKAVFYVSNMSRAYFDEVFHVRAAYGYLNGVDPFEKTHPPLGKILIALGMALFGNNPFGWRIIAALSGAAVIPVMYAFGRKLFGKRIYAFIAAFLMMTDFMHFVNSRVGSVDSFCLLFIMLMFYFTYDYYTNKSYDLGFKPSLKPLFFSGVFFGAAAASKWTGIFGGAGLAVLFVLAKQSELKDYSALTGKIAKKSKWHKDFIRLYMNRTLLMCILFFIVIPGAIYLLSYIPYLRSLGAGHGISDIIENQKYILKFHSLLTDIYHRSSPWWSWPLLLNPYQYFTTLDLPGNKVSVIIALGNPAVWWPGIPAVIAAAVIAVKERSRGMAAALVAFASMYLPWIPVTRPTHIYHFFLSVPFVILAIVYVLKHFIERYPKMKYAAYAYIAINAVLFAMFYPVISGLPVDKDYVRHFLMWLGTWNFV